MQEFGSEIDVFLLNFATKVYSSVAKLMFFSLNFVTKVRSSVAKLMIFCLISLSVPKMLGEAIVLDIGAEGLVDGCNKTRERAEVSH